MLPSGYVIMYVCIINPCTLKVVYYKDQWYKLPETYTQECISIQLRW